MMRSNVVLHERIAARFGVFGRRCHDEIYGAWSGLHSAGYIAQENVKGITKRAAYCFIPCVFHHAFTPIFLFCRMPEVVLLFLCILFVN
ncbi:hypothetical protein [Pectobacterium punjabense]|uniref:hypothetical protein n=1 Tax=Pectobacterium punjabense TaxID=2108399 RepID=UPI001969660C|nr:hypothetical protein [Pectobacterium punjabense]MBN3134448.1 hypothetical protein [Pectobacterium punjabense]MCE5380848.1 hypothetical protein [Pectobacterium punjabense]